MDEDELLEDGQPQGECTVPPPLPTAELHKLLFQQTEQEAYASGEHRGDGGSAALIMRRG